MSMTNYLLKVEVEPLDEGGFLAIAPDLQGCHAEGESIAEALENVEDAARVIIEFSMEKGLPLPPALGSDGIPLIRAELVVRIAS
jgi:antitoxin HicB